MNTVEPWRLRVTETELMMLAHPELIEQLRPEREAALRELQEHLKGSNRFAGEFPGSFWDDHARQRARRSKCGSRIADPAARPTSHPSR